MDKLITILALLLLPLFMSAQVDLNKKGHKLFLEKNYKAAIEAFSEFIETNEVSNQTYYAYHYRGFSYYELGKVNQSISDLENSLKLNKDDKWFKKIVTDSHSLLNRIWEKLGELDKAFKHLELAIELSPKSSELHNNLSLMLFDQGKFDEALETVEIAINYKENDRYAWSNKAKYLLQLGKIDEAFLAIEKSINLDSNNPYAYKHRAMAYIKIGQLKKACKDLKKAKELSYDNFGGVLEEIDAKEVDQLLQKINCGV